MIMDFHTYFSSFRHVENKYFWFFCSKSNGIAVRLNTVENVSPQDLAYQSSTAAIFIRKKIRSFWRELYNNRFHINFSVLFHYLAKKNAEK